MAAVDADSTSDLLARARQGDTGALDILFARYLPALRRWASGRLPRRARHLAETHDLVQDALLQTFRHLDGFEYRHEGAFQAYLRRAVLNRIRQEIRGTRRKGIVETVPADVLAHPGASPLVEAISGQIAERYEAALAELQPIERQAVVARIELGMSFKEIAVELDRPSADAARMLVVRALVRLAEQMHD